VCVCDRGGMRDARRARWCQRVAQEARLDHGDGVDFNLRALGERGDFDRRARGRVFGEACVIGTKQNHASVCVCVCIRE